MNSITLNQLIQLSVHKMKCQAVELYGCELVYELYMHFGITITVGFGIADRNCICVVDIDPVSCEAHLVHT
jgi:hypothetical protein